MPHTRLTIVPVQHRATRGFIDLDAASQASGMHPEMILEFVRSELVFIARQDRQGRPYFDEQAVYRLRKIQYLRESQNAHLQTVRIILKLVDRAEAAERELRELRDRLR